MSVKLGHFELLEQIGKGGMAAVFRAHDTSLNRKVAIKLLDEDLVQQEPHLVDNFLREAQAAASINHPNIVQIYFVGVENENYYIVMELLEGRSLEEIIRQNGPLDEEIVIRIGIKIAEALQAAYTNQLVHGDVKPQNIFITNDGVAKLLDFGLAKIVDHESFTPPEGSVWGSAYYISPERIGRKAEDFRSDIYSLGATLFHALVGHPPFDAETAQELAVKRLHERAPSLRSINPNISKKTERIISKMLEKSAFLRYLDYSALIAELRSTESEDHLPDYQQQGYMATSQLVGQLVENPAEVELTLAQDGASQIKKKLPLIVGGIAAVVLLGGGVMMFATQKKPAQPQATRPATEQVATKAAATGSQTAVPAPKPATAGGFEKLQAARVDTKSETITVQPCSEGGMNLSGIKNNDFAAYYGVNFTGAKGIQFRVSSFTTDSTIEVRTGSPTGQLLGTVKVLKTGGWQRWATVECNVSGATGPQNLFLVFKGVDNANPNDKLVNLAWFKLK